MPEPAWFDDWVLQRRYGRRVASPTEAAGLFAGAPFRWWVAGGWSVDLGEPPARRHEDVDVVVLDRDADAVRQWLRDWHVWEATGEGLRPLTAETARRPECLQWWLRRDAFSPWVADVLLNPAEGEDWVCKRDARVRRSLAEVVVVRDGVPYQAPEVTLLMKARHARDKDGADLDRVYPTLGPSARDWLRDAVRTSDPDSPWNGLLAELDG